MPWSKQGSAIAVLLALVGTLVLLAACGAEATPTPTPRPPTPTPILATPTPIPPTATPTPIPPTPTPLPPGVTPLPATPTSTPLSPTPTPTPKPPLPGPVPSSTYTDAEWAQIVEAAKKEGKLMCYCWQFTTWKGKLVREGMKETYGIDVEVISGSTSILTERILAEARAGVYNVDVTNGLAAIMLGQLDKPDLLRQIDNLPELRRANDPDLWYLNPLLSSSLARVVEIMRVPAGNYTINTRLVPPEREPKRWQDLLDPWWKGKICMDDPMSTANPDRRFSQFWRAQDYAEWWPDYWYDLVNKGTGRLYFYLFGTPDPLPRGECAVSISGGSASATKTAVAIDKVTWTKVGTWDPPVPVLPTSNLSAGVLKKAPHPNASMVFINWLLSREVLTGWAKEKGTDPSLRRDVPNPIEKEYWPANPVTAVWDADPAWLGFEDYTYGRRTTFKLMREGMTREEWKKTIIDSSMLYWGQYPPPPTTFFTLER